MITFYRRDDRVLSVAYCFPPEDFDPKELKKNLRAIEYAYKKACDRLGSEVWGGPPEEVAEKFIEAGRKAAQAISELTG